MLSHRSAAALWEIALERRERLDISIRRRDDLRRPGIRIHSRPSIRAEDVVSKRGIPVTSIVRTLVDLGTELRPRALERAVNESDKRDLIDPETLRARIEDYGGEPGVRSLRELLDKRTFRLSDSDLEILFRPIAAAAGLPPPRTKETVNGFEVDFFWPNLGLVVETDGLRYHRTASTQTRDARRDRAHALAGMTPLRFTHYEIKHEAAAATRQLAAALALLRARNLNRPRPGVVDSGSEGG
jgi:very-short-patch-repair endonuclease